MKPSNSKKKQLSWGLSLVYFIVTIQMSTVYSMDPDWWPERVPEGINVKRCEKRDGLRKPLGPPSGACARIPKTCFFNDQFCGDGDTTYPAIRCYCDGIEWTCSPEPCPPTISLPEAPSPAFSGGSIVGPLIGPPTSALLDLPTPTVDIFEDGCYTDGCPPSEVCVHPDKPSCLGGLAPDCRFTRCPYLQESSIVATTITDSSGIFVFDQVPVQPSCDASHICTTLDVIASSYPLPTCSTNACREEEDGNLLTNYCMPKCTPGGCGVGRECDEQGFCQAKTCDAVVTPGELFKSCPRSFDCVDGRCQRRQCSSRTNCVVDLPVTRFDDYCITGFCYERLPYCIPIPV